jgi:hypothetical protein
VIHRSSKPHEILATKVKVKQVYLTTRKLRSGLSRSIAMIRAVCDVGVLRRSVTIYVDSKKAVVHL